MERQRKALFSGFFSFQKTQVSSRHYLWQWVTLLVLISFLFRRQRKGKRMFWITLFSHVFFLYSTLILKLEDWTKPGLLLVMKGGIFCLPLKGFWHSYSFVPFEISLSNSRVCSDSELQYYYQKATIVFFFFFFKNIRHATISTGAVATHFSN